MKKCARCGNEIVRGPRANNVKYCGACRIEAYKYTEYRTGWQRKRREEKAERETRGKIACMICGRYYYKPISHAWQVHGVHEREYKKTAGLDHQKGVIPAEHREILREHVRDNYDIVVAKNLVGKGKQTRFIKGDARAGRYERSEETKQRLIEQGHKIARKRKQK